MQRPNTNQVPASSPDQNPFISLPLKHFDAATLKISRSIALTDVLQLASRTGDLQPENLTNCLGLLYELLVSLAGDAEMYLRQQPG